VDKAIGYSKCPQLHFLKKDINGSSGRKTNCDDCLRKSIQSDGIFFYCPKCDFDICIKCRNKNEWLT
jgi:hypothetical protein